MQAHLAALPCMACLNPPGLSGNQIRSDLAYSPFFPESVVGFPPCHQPHLHNLPPRADLLCMEFWDQRSPDPPRKPGAAGLRKKLNWIFCQTGDNRCNKRFGFALESLNLILLSVLICQEIEGALLLSLNYAEGIVSATYHENEQNTKTRWPVPISWSFVWD